MAADGIQDRFQVLGVASETLDIVSSTGMGYGTAPAPPSQGTHYPIGGGLPPFANDPWIKSDQSNEFLPGYTVAVISLREATAAATKAYVDAMFATAFGL